MTASDENASQIVLRYCKLQRQLVERFREDLQPRDLDYFSDVARNGSLQLGSQTWQYARHGAGVAFESPAAVVDAHVGLATFPDAVDGWRLLLYLESAGTRAITFGGETAMAGDEEELERLLERMTRAGILEEVRLRSGRRLFRPSIAISGT